MDQSKIDMFFMTNAKYFPEEKSGLLKGQASHYG